MKRTILVAFLVIGFFAGLFPCTKGYSDIIPIDLNDFYKDPSVVIGPGISSATMVEDLGLTSIWLSNDPLLADPGISVPLNLLTMSFSYSFTEPTLTNNNDSFYAKVFDGAGNIIQSFQIEDPGSGRVSWDLSTLDSSITLLGLEFQLNANTGDSGLDSFVTLTDVQLETATTAVPEPATMILLGTGLIGLIGVGRRKHRKLSRLITG